MISSTKTLFAILYACLWNGTVYAQSEFTKHVDPYIGSAEHGHVFVGANVPFGAVQLGPTQISQSWDKFNGWDWCSGYNYKSEEILGFTHTHLSGTGIGDLNDILLLPASGKPRLTPAPFNKMSEGYGSLFKKENEISKPGYYSVFLDDYQIQAELTATERVGFHRYTFHKQDQQHLVLDLGFQMNWDKTTDSYLKQVNDSTFVGYRFSTGWASDQKIYFALIVSTPIEKMDLYNANKAVLEYSVAKGDKIKAILHLKAAKTVLVKVGISPVSTKNALENMQKEVPKWNFDEIKSEANDKWNIALGKINFVGDTERQKIFYTALYHAHFSPTLFDDTNGEYMGTDKQVHQQADDAHNYTTFSLWDTYRALHPLMSIIDPQRNSDFVKSMLRIYQQQGKLPVWHLHANETNTMVGLPAIPIIADALLKGQIDAADQDLAYEAVKTTAMGYEHGLQYVKNLGHIPTDSMENESVAWALEYAIADYGAYRMAKTLGKSDDAIYFEKRYKLYQKYFDKSVGHFVGLNAKGDFRRPFDPLMAKHRQNDYCEGNAWQYTWLVPHDVQGLIQLFGGDKTFVEKLDTFINLPEVLDDASPDISGMIGQYAQGNEPNHHVPYLYTFAGQPWKTAQLVRKAMTKYYTTEPNGLCGNDDAGQMSAWYVFSALGIYPANPMDGIYVFGSPMMENATIHVGNGKTFEINVKNYGKDNEYITAVKLNGKPYTNTYITHETIVKGGILEMEMDHVPNKKFGTSQKSRP